MNFNYTYNYPQVARDSGFKLRNYKDGPLDWRLMGSLEVERIVREQCLEQIDLLLDHICEAPLGSILDSNILDGGIAKYFILSQFSVQYLLFCRKFLEETVADLRESHSASQMELATLKRSLSEANNEILQLHKKITQMEAIHEVIYPCHLCTKNFVSNDALNLHISRKHNGSINKPEKRCETPPQSVVRDRDNDLALINTIKLELEIKQLKERLNNAEREIKERNLAPNNRSSSKDVRESGKYEKLSVNSIGIQSNLSEIKEKDDNSEDDLSNSSQNREQFCMLQKKLQEFDRWKDEQKNQNSEFLIEINQKLQDLSKALESTKNEREQKFSNENLKSSPSVEDLEALLSKKVEDIGKASVAKLEEVVNKMEMNYKAKLDEFEKDMKKINEISKTQKESKSNTSGSAQNSTTSNVEQIRSTKSNGDTFEIVNIRENKIPRDELKEICTNDEKSMKEKLCVQKQELRAFGDKSTSDSNHTFIKSKIITHLEKTKDQKQFSSSDEDECTDVSESLQDEEQEEANEISKNFDENKTYKLIEEHPKVHKKPIPRIVTRKQVIKLTNSRLASLGVEMKSNVLTQATKKRFSAELNEKRNKIKQKHPNFYATRNKIKKFVDKLCSSRMPKNAEDLLKATKPLKVKSKLKESEESEYSSSDENGTFKASTPLNDTISRHSIDFKHRLERILASPIRIPDDHNIKAVVHQHQSEALEKPVPMPRKRVMFNKPEVQEKRIDESLTITESDESLSSNRYLKRQVLKK